MLNVANGREKRKLFNFRPALFAAIFLIFGILFAYYRITRGVSFAWLCLFLPLTVVPFFFGGNKREIVKRFSSLLLLAAFFIVGYVSFRAQIASFQAAKVYEGEVTVVGTVEYKSEYDYSVALQLKDLYVDEKKTEGKLNAYLYPSYAEEIEVGDEVVLRGEIATDTSLKGKFGVRDNAIDGKIYYVVSDVEEIAKIGKSDNWFLRIRSRMEDVVYAGMDETPAALTIALITGEDSGVEEGLVENMRYGGIIHIFAVSGLNVGALYGFCLLLFSKTPLKRAPKPVRFFLVVGTLIFYSGVCGFTPSVARAAVTCAVHYFFRLLASSLDLLEAMGVSAIFILFLSPVQLFDVGFQLSYLACVGLFFLTKPIGQVFDECKNAFRKRFPKRLTEEEKKAVAEGDTLPETLGESVYRWIASVLSASIAAQITTAPLLTMRFGFLSGWSLLLNFIFVPFIDGMFTILLVMVVIACFLPVSLSGGILFLPSIVWSGSTLLFEAMDFSTFALTGVTFSAMGCVAYYAWVVFLSDKINLSAKRRKIVAWSFFLAFLACTIAVNV